MPAPIQSLDLLARKLPQNEMAGYAACLAEMEKAIVNAREYPELVECADALQAGQSAYPFKSLPKARIGLRHRAVARFQF
jgi:hypothetical protein